MTLPLSIPSNSKSPVFVKAGSFNNWPNLSLEIEAAIGQSKDPYSLLSKKHSRSIIDSSDEPSAKRMKLTSISQTSSIFEFCTNSFSFKHAVDMN